jgi:hypothetical protein
MCSSEFKEQRLQHYCGGDSPENPGKNLFGSLGHNSVLYNDGWKKFSLQINIE